VLTAMFCTRCGSTSHTAYDCSAPDRRLTPPEAAQPDAAETDSDPVAVEAAEPEDGPALSARPRHKSWPPTCVRTGLLAFDSQDLVCKFIGRWCPRCKATRVWTCESCGRTHFEATTPSPSGDDSGHPRDSKLPRSPFVPFKRKPMRESAFGTEPDLPKQERPAPAPTKRATPPASMPKKEGMLL
jgi:hypothetical protein